MSQNIHSLDQHSFGQSVLMHLLPGFLIGGCYLVLRPILSQWGYPSILALMGSIFLMLLPIELGWLMYEGKKRNGRFSLQGVVSYRVPIPIWQYLIWVPGLFVLLGLIFTLMKPVDTFVQQRFFAWLPTLEGGLETGYSQSVLIVTWVIVAIFGTVVGPTVEELYFRGYLLPRMGYAGKWAPSLHCFLFGLYHTWTPWMFLTRTLGMLPLVYAVRWRNLNLAIIVHILVNLVDVITAAAFIVGMSSHG
jgi:membrane protease YdiL (CAAX protease family)